MVSVPSVRVVVLAFLSWNGGCLTCVVLVVSLVLDLLHALLLLWSRPVLRGVQTSWSSEESHSVPLHICPCGGVCLGVMQCLCVCFRVCFGWVLPQPSYGQSHPPLHAPLDVPTSTLPLGPGSEPRLKTHQPCPTGAHTPTSTIHGEGNVHPGGSPRTIGSLPSNRPRLTLGFHRVDPSLSPPGFEKDGWEEGNPSDTWKRREGTVPTRGTKRNTKERKEIKEKGGRKG